MTLQPDKHTWYGGNVEFRSYLCLECDEKMHAESHTVPEFCPYCGES